MRFKSFICSDLKISLLVFIIAVLSGCGQKNENRKSNSNPVISDTSSETNTPLISVYEAALNGQISIINAHLEKGTNVNLPDEEGRTPLMYASYNGHTEVIKKLIEKGANVNIQDPFGRTALMMAASGPFPETVKVLLDGGADPNLIDKEEHFTALMYAAAEGQLEVVRVLLTHNADSSLKDVDGDNAVTFATNNGHKAVADLIRSFSK